MSGIIEFLEARIAEDEAAASNFEYEIALALNGSYGNWQLHYGAPADWRAVERIGYPPARVLDECAAKRAILEQHKDWPVLVEKKPEFVEAGSESQSVLYRVTQEMAWLTQREYVKCFGIEPPTTNMIRALAAVYKDHPDYRQEWAT